MCAANRLSASATTFVLPAWCSILKLYPCIDNIQRMTRFVADVESLSAEFTSNCVDGLLSDLTRKS